MFAHKLPFIHFQTHLRLCWQAFKFRGLKKKYPKVLKQGNYFSGALVSLDFHYAPPSQLQPVGGATLPQMEGP